jgi:hypothetical protein
LNNQDDQFIGPEQYNPEQYSVYSDPEERQATYISSGNNIDPGTFRDWNVTPPPPPPTYDNPYESWNPYASTTSQGISGYQVNPPHARKRRSWPCVVLALLLVLVLCGGAVGGAVYGYTFLTSRLPATSVGLQAPGAASGLTTISVGVHPTVKIDRNTGLIRVHPSNKNGIITIQASDSTHNPINQAIPYSQGNNGGAIIFDVSNFETDDVDIAVPQTTDLNLNTNDGNINVSGITGVMALTSNAGSIIVSQAALNGQSKLETNGGSIRATQVTLNGSTGLSTNGDNITFTGSLNRQGTYTFDTTTGMIDITLAANSAFHVDATSDTSSITTNFSGVRVTNSNPGSEAHGNVGKAPRARLTITASTGSIKLLKGP